MDYWLQTLGHFAGGQPPVIIAVTQCDAWKNGADRPIDLRDRGDGKTVWERGFDKSEATHGATVVGVIDPCSACDRKIPIQPLRRAIEAALGQLTSLDDRVTIGLRTVKRRVEAELTGDRSLARLDHFYKWCEEAGITEPDRRDTCLRVLHWMGSLFYFGLTRTEQRERDRRSEDGQLAEWFDGFAPGQRRFLCARRDTSLREHVVSPRWLKRPLYEVIGSSEAKRWQTTSQVERVIRGSASSPLTDGEISVVKAALELWELCFYQEREGRYLFPRGLDRSPLALCDRWPAVSARWDFLPEAVFHRLMVRMHARQQVALGGGRHAFAPAVGLCGVRSAPSGDAGSGSC